MSRSFRFNLILFLAGLCTTLAAVGGWRYARASAPVSGPIILISIDSLRADHLPPYGYARVRTPAIDALAADGIVFERAYTHSPQTLPAHAALLTGRLPFENGVRDDDATIKSSERLLPQMLRDRGYATAAVVSTPRLSRATGIGQGFDFFDADLNGRPRDGGESERIAERWLSSHESTRAFLMLQLNEPHAPYTPPNRYSDYDAYDGEIAYADEIVGRLVKYLKSHQLYDRSTIILLADHGEGLGDHGEQEHGLLLYEEAIHVPLIVKQESNANPGRRVGDVVQHVDLVPTVLDLVKAPIPWGLHGRSLKPLLEDTGHPDPIQVYAESQYGRIHFGWSELTALIDDKHQYIRAPREELFDLSHDRSERTNLVAEHAEPARPLRNALERLVHDAAAPVPEDLPDPKDKIRAVNTYRTAAALAEDGQWPQAIPLLQAILHDDPEMVGAWWLLNTVAARIDRYEDSLTACWHWIGLRPEEPTAYLGAASALLHLRRLDEAREQAMLALAIAPERDRTLQASVHEALARIALAARDGDTAEEEAALAKKANPALPLPLYVEARSWYDQGRFDEASISFERALADAKKPAAPPIADLHYYAGETLVRLDRLTEAETEFIEELRLFPQNVRAHAALATLYHTMARADEASSALSMMTQAMPTPETYAQAARLATVFGDRKQADALRADARRAFADGAKNIRTAPPH